MIDNPWFYAVAIPGILLTGISKGGFAGGLSFLAVAMMSLVIPPVQAAGITLPILCVMDAFGFWSWRQYWDKALIRKLLPGAMLGVLLGAILFRYMNDALVQGLIGLLALLFALNYWFKNRVRAPWHLPDHASAGLWSTLSGFTSFVSHAGGPPMMIYLLPRKLDKSVLVATLTLLFTVINYAKLLPYAWLGQLNTINLTTALVLAPLAPLGVKLGIWLHDRISEAVFYRLTYFFMLLTGLKLCWNAAGKLSF